MRISQTIWCTCGTMQWFHVSVLLPLGPIFTQLVLQASHSLHLLTSASVSMTGNEYELTNVRYECIWKMPESLSKTQLQDRQANYHFLWLYLKIQSLK